MTTNLRSFIFILFTVASGIALLTGDAQAEISGLESYPLVCQKGLLAIDHNITSFNKLFGPPILEKRRKLTTPEDKGVIVTTVTYQNAVKLIYATTNEKYMVYEITLGSSEAQKKIGFDIQTKKDVRKLYGAPYEDTSNSLKYGCDNVDITFKTQNERVIAVDITVSDL